MGRHYNILIGLGEFMKLLRWLVTAGRPFFNSADHVETPPREMHSESVTNRSDRLNQLFEYWPKLSERTNLRGQYF